ncbi:DUF3624 family protein [Rhizobium indigoferae]|uniref:DUF3624 family protein n=1 Tax=Rhizobium indigoferae TaxID=158891 RepID=UPI0017974CB5|nr:DUF3624 family protein [Rhizobium indigoferae]GLR59337.1 hypothetical protein GCM10007919_40640 [Rhizobium indigoferae]
MLRIVQFAREYSALFGRCPRCMRQSFLAASVAGIVTITLFGIYREINAITVLATTGFGATILLWLAHITAFAWRVASGKVRQSALSDGATQERRTVLLNFGQAFVAMALATSAIPVRWPMIPSNVDKSDPKREKGTILAMNCWDGQCGGGTYCCQWGDDSWCCQNGTSCAPSVRGCS